MPASHSESVPNIGQFCSNDERKGDAPSCPKQPPIPSIRLVADFKKKWIYFFVRFPKVKSVREGFQDSKTCVFGVKQCFVNFEISSNVIKSVGRVVKGCPYGVCVCVGGEGGMWGGGEEGGLEGKGVPHGGRPGSQDSGGYVLASLLEP